VKVRDRWDRWAALNAAALFVVFDEPALIRRTMLDGIDPDGLPFPVLVDRDRSTYTAWGLTRARRRDIWLDPNVYRVHWRLVRAGDRLRPGGTDILQLGGDFIVAPDGRITSARPQQRDDGPSVGELLRDAGAGPTLIVSPLLVSPGQLNHPRFRAQILGCTAAFLAAGVTTCGPTPRGWMRTPAPGSRWRLRPTSWSRSSRRPPCRWATTSPTRGS
jgi:hypothetical protein